METQRAALLDYVADVAVSSDFLIALLCFCLSESRWVVEHAHRLFVSPLIPTKQKALPVTQERLVRFSGDILSELFNLYLLQTLAPLQTRRLQLELSAGVD